LAERDLAVEASDNSDKLFHLRRALRLCPNSAPLHHELGKVYASMQRTKDAEGEFQQALSIDPSFSAAKKELGALLKDEVHF
jgi:Flp pilus assembly protein TadD